MTIGCLPQTGRLDTARVMKVVSAEAGTTSHESGACGPAGMCQLTCSRVELSEPVLAFIKSYSYAETTRNCPVIWKPRKPTRRPCNLESLNTLTADTVQDMRLTVTLPANHLGGVPESLKSLHFIRGSPCLKFALMTEALVQLEPASAAQSRTPRGGFASEDSIISFPE
jgi:hypothetical protein